MSASPATHPGTIDDRVLLHHADAEAGEIVVRAVVHAGHLGGLPADQRRAGLHAALDDPAHHGLGDGHLELAGGVVVEEEQRLGALDDHVVGAHGHQIDADRVVAAGVDREPQLGADAVGAGDEHRAAVAGRQLDQGAETADAGEHLGALRAAHERLDALDEFVAGVDVDARVAVGDAMAFGHVRTRSGWAAVGCRRV